MRTVTGIPTQTINEISLVGRTVTYQNAQYTVTSVEGRNFNAMIENGTITVDFGLTEAAWLRSSIAWITSTITGDKFPVPVNSRFLKRGVCLAKRAI